MVLGSKTSPEVSKTDCLLSKNKVAYSNHALKLTQRSMSRGQISVLPVVSRTFLSVLENKAWLGTDKCQNIRIKASRLNLLVQSITPRLLSLGGTNSKRIWKKIMQVVQLGIY